MESISKSDTQPVNASAGPNIIGNAEEGANPFNRPGFKFNEFVKEKSKARHNERLSLDQFARKVDSKSNLLFALGVKGK